MTPVIRVAGTWAADDHGLGWWRESSPFAQHGIRALVVWAPEFHWSTELDGLIGEDRGWAAAGAALYSAGMHAGGGSPVSLIAHSHGGQVALYAAAYGLEVDRLITVATPVRGEMELVAKIARKRIRYWVHLRSDRSDRMQWLGEIGDRVFGIRRDFALADANILEPGVGHSGLLDPMLWDRRRWWNLLQTSGRYAKQ